MKKIFKSKLAIEIVMTSFGAILVIAGVVGATTIGTNISTSGTLTVTDSSTMATTTISGGDLIVDTSTLVVDNDNNKVGIGSTTPSALLSAGVAASVSSATTTIDFAKPCFRMTTDSGTMLYYYISSTNTLGGWATSTTSCF
jgi:hypothetical protein